MDEDKRGARVIGAIIPTLPDAPGWLPTDAARVWRCRQIVALAITCPECGAQPRELCSKRTNRKQWAHYVRVVEGITYAGADPLRRNPSAPDRTKERPPDHSA